MLPSAAGRAGFHPLRVSDVERLTDDSVAVTFAVPPELHETYRHLPGQHLALRRSGEQGEEIRRTYSICAPAAPAGEPPSCASASGSSTAARSRRTRSRN